MFTTPPTPNGGLPNQTVNPNFGPRFVFAVVGSDVNTVGINLNTGIASATLIPLTGSRVYATATPVPFESDALPVVGSALFMAGGLWWKKKRAQAKVAEFVAKD